MLRQTEKWPSGLRRWFKTPVTQQWVHGFEYRLLRVSARFRKGAGYIFQEHPRRYRAEKG